MPKSKYFLYKMKNTINNMKISEKYEFEYEDLNHIWVYTNKKKPTEDCEKINIKEVVVAKEISDWILECEIIIAKKIINNSKENINESINYLFGIIDNELSKRKNKEQDNEDING